MVTKAKQEWSVFFGANVDKQHGSFEEKIFLPNLVKIMSLNGFINPKSRFHSRSFDSPVHGKFDKCFR